MTGGASGVNSSMGNWQKSVNKKTNDFGFNKSLWNLKHYYNLSNEYNKELGDFLHKNTSNLDYYGNDLRHQYVSAIFARNLGGEGCKNSGKFKRSKRP